MINYILCLKLNWNALPGCRIPLSGEGVELKNQKITAATTLKKRVI